MPLVTDEETERTIQAWAREAFGPAPAPGRIAARANEEMAELLTAAVSAGQNPKISAEQADELAAECADIVIMLCRMADRLGFDLGQAIDQKMRINRARRWTVEDGVGKHVK